MENIRTISVRCSKCLIPFSIVSKGKKDDRVECPHRKRGHLRTGTTEN